MSNTPWRKSSYSGADNGQCLEVRDGISTAVPVRDSKNPAGPQLTIPADAWQVFVRKVVND
jgi:hypothetical protein